MTCTAKRLASILASHEVAGSAFPAVGGYTTALWLGAGIAVFATLVAVGLAPAEERTAAPVDEAEARAMIGEVKGLATIRGYRNLPRGDVSALARAIAALTTP